MASVFQNENGTWNYGTKVYGSLAEAQEAERNENQRIANMFLGNKSGGNKKSGGHYNLIGWAVVFCAIFVGLNFGERGLITGIVFAVIGFIVMKIKKSQDKRVNGIAQEAWDLFNQGNYTLALEKAEEVAEKNSDAADLAGVLYLNGEGCDVNEEKAFKYFELGKDKNMEAKTYYAIMLLTGKGCAQNIELGGKELRKAASVGKDPLAIMRVGELQISGEFGFEKNVEQGMKNLRIAMDQGYPYAMYLVGKMQFAGTDGVPMNKEKGIELLQKAAENGIQDAADFLESLNK